MSNQATVKIDDVEYVRVDSINVTPTTKQIVVLQRGWIVVGDVCKTEHELAIKNCSVIQRWGTTKGLGEIAENGPTSKTVLDKCTDIFVHPLSVVFCMNVNEGNW